MTKKNTGYQINEKDIEATLKYLKLNGEPEATREDAIQYLEEHQVMAHVAAHKIVEDEQLAIAPKKEVKKLESGD